MHTNKSFRPAQGFTLIELIVFIMIVSVAVAGVLSVLTVAAKSSSDPLRVKQANIIAQNLLDEVLSHPLRDCASSNFRPQACPGRPPVILALPPQAASSTKVMQRLSFVEDYDGLSMSAIKAADGRNIAGLENYSATVTVTPDGNTFSVPNDDAMRINVLVRYSGGRASLTGYRFRYPSQ
jgi:MSHA pilin protein MshD